MNKRLVFQINVPNFTNQKKMASYKYIEGMYETSERNARRYAAKCNADYILISDPAAYTPAAGKTVTYQKLKVYEFVEYDQILYLDSDYIIKDNAPNLFEICQDKFSAATDPGSIVHKIAKNLGIPADRYFNAGLIYFTKDVLDKTRNVVNSYLEKDWQYEDQGLWNRMFFDHNIDYNKLPAEDWNQTDSTFGTYGDHYAGPHKIRWGTVTY